MKLKHVISSLCVAMAISFGVFAGVSAHKEAKVAKAEESYSGSIIVQKNDTDAKWDGCNLVAHIFDEDSHSGWSAPIDNDTNKYQEFSWTANFEATKIIVLRVAKDWNKDVDPWGTGVYARTGNIDLASSDVVWMDGNASETEHWGTYHLNAVVKGGASDDWSVQTVDASLSGVKIGADNKLEAYGSVHLPANSYFKIVKEGSVWCNDYTPNSLVADNLSVVPDGNQNIHNVAEATYEFYFDYDSLNTYITDPVLAAADEYGQYFLSHVGCDADGKLEPTGWSDCATEYGKLANDVKDYIYGLTGNVGGSYIEHAVARYDYAVAHHPGLTKFIVNSSSTPRAAIAIEGLEYNHSFEYGYIIIISASVVAISALALLLLKKRKQR